MASATPPSFGPGVRTAFAALGIDGSTLVDAAGDGSTRFLRPADATLDLAVLHGAAPDTGPLLDEADRLLWLADDSIAPELLASGRSDDGDETLVVSLGADATTAAAGHPMGPEALVDVLAGALVRLHARSTDQCPFVADTAALRGLVDERVAADLVADAGEGPYAGRSATELAGICDDLMADLGATADPVFVHGAITPGRIWLDPSGGVSLLGWHRAGVGDRHVDLAAVATLLTQLYGPALVGPFFDAYGFDHIDIRRLDAHQLLTHLLS